VIPVRGCGVGVVGSCRTGLTAGRLSQIFYCPGKAANAGGVAVSALEMSQNSQRLQWEKAEVDAKLDDIMKSIYEACRDTAETFDQKIILC
jgi:glutamate dehydrogenase/leucine dehydrogenase